MNEEYSSAPRLDSTLFNVVVPRPRSLWGPSCPRSATRSSCPHSFTQSLIRLTQLTSRFQSRVGESSKVSVLFSSGAKIQSKEKEKLTTTPTDLLKSGSRTSQPTTLKTLKHTDLSLSLSLSLSEWIFFSLSVPRVKDLCLQDGGIWQ